MDNIADIMSRALVATLEAEKRGYNLYVEILRQLEGRKSIEFNYIDNENRQRTLKVPPITLIPLTMLHIKRATYDFSLSVSSYESKFSGTGNVPDISGGAKIKDVDPIVENGKTVCFMPTVYTSFNKGSGQVKIANEICIGQLNYKSNKKGNKWNGKLFNSSKARYFVFIDGNLYIPFYVKKTTKINSYITSTFLMMPVSAGLKDDEKIVYVNDKSYNKKLLRRRIQYTFYKDGSFKDLAGNVFYPSSKGTLKHFSARIVTFDREFSHSFSGYYISKELMNMNEGRLVVNSKNSEECNLNISVKMGQANISSGLISALNKKDLR